MKKLKNIFTGRHAALLLSVCMLVLAAAGCGGDGGSNGRTAGTQDSGAGISGTDEYAPEDIKAAALKGPTAIGMVYMMKQAKEGKLANNYEFTLAASADEFTSLLVKGDIQIAALPCNAAATLYNKSGGKIRVLGINTLGVLYILDTGDSVHEAADLKGKTIYATGKGTTPEYTLRYLLKSAGVDPDKDVSIEFKSEAAEIAALMASSGEETIALLPQPYVSSVQMRLGGKARVALDVTKEWERLEGSDSTVVTGVVAVNAAYYESHRAAVEKFVEEYRESIEYVNSNVQDAAQLVQDFGIFDLEVAKRAIPYCNITYIGGSDMRAKIENYLKVLYDQNPDSVGGKMPDEGFYAEQEQ